VSKTLAENVCALVITRLQLNNNNKYGFRYINKIIDANIIRRYLRINNAVSNIC